MVLGTGWGAVAVMRNLDPFKYEVHACARALTHMHARTHTPKLSQRRHACMHVRLRVPVISMTLAYSHPSLRPVSLHIPCHSLRLPFQLICAHARMRTHTTHARARAHTRTRRR